MAESAPLQQGSLSPVGQPGRSERPGRVWLWIGLIALIGIVAPAVGCGAFGFALMVGSYEPAGVGPAVGVIRVEGQIMAGRSPGVVGGIASSETIIDLIEQADRSSSVEAIVLRIDSPGGDAVASDEIHHALTRVDKPIVVSMGTLAASGGYYIAAPADYIYATPGTLTGSIGVISQFYTAEELLDTIGLDVVVITAGESKDFGSPFREMTEEERAYWESLIDETHERFIEVVAEGRGLDIVDVRAIADGRVFSGQQAVELGLVDEIGYFDDAIAKAAELGGISGEPRIVEFAPEPSFLEALYGFQAHPDPAQAIVSLLRGLSVPSLEMRLAGP